MSVLGCLRWVDGRAAPGDLLLLLWLPLIFFSMHSFSPHSGLTRYTLMKMCPPHHSCTCVRQSWVFALLAGVSIFAISGVAITVLMLRVTVPWASLLVEVAAASFDFCQK